MGDGRMIRVDGVQLCVDTFGDNGDHALLLIGGGSSSMDWWDPAFCEALAEEHRFVIRYDQRATGRSTTGSTKLSITDLQADVLGVLDVLGLPAAHLVGMSLGGSVALRVALAHPGRVATLTLLSTSPGGPDLPSMSDDLREYFGTAVWPPDWSDRGAVVDYLVSAERAFEAPGYFDETHVRELVERIVDRADDIAAGMTRWSEMDMGTSIRGRLRDIDVPALIIHGTADPMYPYGHAEVLAAELPDTRLLPLDGVGHQLPPPPVWPIVVRELVRHTADG